MIDNSPYEIRRQIGVAAALKLARIARQENPTPVSHESGARVCLRFLKTLRSPLDTAPIEEAKLKRWYNLLREFNHGGARKLRNGGEEI